MDHSFDKTEESIEEMRERPLPAPGGGFRRGFLGGFLTGLLLVCVLAGGAALGRYMAKRQIEEQLPAANGNGILTDEFTAEVNAVYQRISQYFLYDFDDKKLQDGMLSGMLNALDDPYSVYYNESALESFTNQTEGEYYGIGCVVNQNRATGVITLVKPYAGSPAYEAGLLPGDVLYAVGEEEVTGMDLEQVVSMIKGAEGSTVRLAIVREGAEDMLYFDVERRQVEVNTVEHEMLEGQIGYIAVSSFDGVTPNQFRAAFEDLQAQGMRGLVIDMRDNGGGLLTAVEEMLDYLLPEGIIFYAKDKAGNRYLEYESDAAAALNVPLAVLVNGNTASAAEVFSGNIQDFGVGILVGTTTFGKGIMQNTYTTNPQGTRAVKLTVADYYIHSDRNIHEIGLTPDVEIALSEEATGQAVLDKTQDNQLQEALRQVQEQLP